MSCTRAASAITASTRPTRPWLVTTGIPRQHGGGGRSGAGGVPREMGWSLSVDQPDAAAELESSDAVFRLPGRHWQGDLHHQYGGAAEHVAAEGDQDAGLVSRCGRGDEAAVSGAGTHRPEVEQVLHLQCPATILETHFFCPNNGVHHRTLRRMESNPVLAFLHTPHRESALLLLAPTGEGHSSCWLSSAAHALSL